MRQRRQREVWNTLGRTDADWAVLTAPERRSGRWEKDIEAFYESGRRDVTDCLALCQLAASTKALDYGAGTGRLSFALASRFGQVTSLDVSEEMLAVLEERATGRNIRNVSVVHVDQFVASADHDFALSLLVLQHLPDRASVQQAIRTIASGLRPGGVAVIELPERALLVRARLQPRLRLYQLLRSLGFKPGRLNAMGLSGIAMLTLQESEARAMFEHAGLSVVRRAPRPDRDFDYVRWVLRRDSH
jgi:2-polyprenyl-3-methyl-5-hydroxy-6-metoxy-1,4-benzoquinol methylase